MSANRSWTVRIVCEDRTIPVFADDGDGIATAQDAALWAVSSGDFDPERGVLCVVNDTWTMRIVPLDDEAFVSRFGEL